MGLFNIEKKRLKVLNKIADKVFEKESLYIDMDNATLINQTNVLKQRLEKGETLDDILPDAFAVAREAAFRVLNMRHFRTQVIGGIALHQGRIAEMRTGEGKTLTSTLPAYLNALSGKGVHIVTVNEYLSKRDAEWMGKVHRFLGLSVGISLSGMDEKQKRAAYACDITYATNNELGFDYLRDNMAIEAKRRVQRGHNFVIVDEVDSILIDEARTPLIISGKGMKSSAVYATADKFAKTLKIDEDFEVDIKIKAIHLSEQGIEKAEKFFKVENLSDIDNIELNHHIQNALKANFIFKRDENYIVSEENEILIVDEFTGRIMQGRRYSDGVHQAIEAKENVKINDENKTLATITFQNYFRLYRKLSGMTGTAKTEESEFNGIYNIDVITIPTIRGINRVDYNDIVYRTEKGKLMAVCEDILEKNKTGQPILVGTTTIEKSEEISKFLNKNKIKHVVLNAKNHKLESEIIAQAGRLGAITIATNMAGRGTDILLGGNAEFMATKKMREENFTEEEISFATSFAPSEEENLLKARSVYQAYYDKYKKVTDEEKQKVIEAGGLHIIGTERHESRRIDNQLRGRSGRLGDIGSSIFYLSLQDDLIIRFGGDKLQKVADFLKINDETPLQMRILTRQIEGAQKRIEAQNYASRKSVLQFDDVMSKQREIIYGERNKVLDGVDIHHEIMEMFPNLVSNLCKTYLDSNKPFYEWDLRSLNLALEERLFPKGTELVTEEFVDDCEIEDVEEKILNTIYARYEETTAKLAEFKVDFSHFERLILLRVVDSLWMDHIDQMSILKNEIRLQALAQRDPVVEYKRVGFEMFDDMIDRIHADVTGYLLNTKIEIRQKPIVNQPNFKPADVVENAPKAVENAAPQAKQPKVNTEQKIGRNDLCSCGSGKKYKSCCGKKED